MSVTLEELASWMIDDEAEHLEFKEAKNDFDALKLVRYCAAMANEGGGRLVLGVTDKRPRRVVGSRAFLDLGATKHQLVDRLRLRVEAEALVHPGGRVVVFSVPGRPIGSPIPVDGAYLMRSGESLDAMTPDFLRRIFAEAQPDYSAELCTQATLDDLAPEAIERFRARWAEKSKCTETPGYLIASNRASQASSVWVHSSVCHQKKLTLSRRFYAFVGKRGEYTRRRGLDRGTNKALLLQHIEQNVTDGSPFVELNEVLPGMKPTQVQNLLRELKRDGRAHPVGRTKGARWFPGRAPEGDHGE